MIEVEINTDGQILKLFDNEEFSMSFRIQEIANLTAIQSSVSTSFSIPVFNDYQVTQINSDNNKPYDYISCNLRVDGVYIFQRGLLAIEEVEDDTLLVTLYEGNIDFISQIEGLTFADLDLSALNHEWQYDDVVASFTNIWSDGYIYPVIEYGNAQTVRGLGNIRTEYLHPAIYCKYILQEIFALTTFTPTGSAYTDSFFERCIYPFSTAFRYSRDKRNTTGTVTVGGNFPTIADGGNVYYQSTPTYTAVSDPIGYRDVDGFLFDTTTRLFGTATVNNTSANPGIIGIYKIATDGTITTLDFFNTPAGTNITYNLSAIDVDFLTGEKVFFGQEVTSAPDAALITWTDYEFRFGYNYINELLPQEIELKDFVKAIFAQFGIISQVNVFTNELELHKFEELGDNKSNAIDWSNKIDFNQKFRIEYHAEDFGQNNYFAYKELDNVDITISRQRFTISDNTLPSEVDWIELEFGACEEVSIVGQTCITIEKYESEANDINDLRATADTKPRLAYIETQFDSTTYTDGISSGTFGSPERRISARFEDLQFSNLIGTNYQDFVSSFDKFKKLTAYFRLSQLDIANLDFFTPIYLNVGLGGQIFLNAYFYINIINNFRNDESTQVELIRINI